MYKQRSVLRSLIIYLANRSRSRTLQVFLSTWVSTSRELTVPFRIGLVANRSHSVANPNYFSVNFNEIKVDVSSSVTLHLEKNYNSFMQIFYPINETHVGGGSVKNVDIKSNQETNFTLPFTFNYTETIDPNFNILEDLAGRCGFISGTPKSQLAIDYKIQVSLARFNFMRS